MGPARLLVRVAICAWILAGEGWRDKHTPRPNAQQGSVLNLAYDQMPVKEEKSGSNDERGTSASNATPPNLTQQLQKALNASRKAFGRARKLEEDRRQKVQQWNAFQAQLKKTYNQQHAKHNSDLEKIDAELLLAQEAVEEAELKLKQIPLQLTQHAMAAEVDMEGGPDPWEDFMRTNVEEQEDVRVAQYLKKAMDRARHAGSITRAAEDELLAASCGGVSVDSRPARPAAPSEAGRVPTTVSATQAHLANMAYGSSPIHGTVPTDPYLFGAGLLKTGPAGGQPIELASTPITPPRRPASTGQRTPIKEVGKVKAPLKTARPPGLATQAKLEQRRAQVMREEAAHNAETVELTDSDDAEDIKVGADRAPSLERLDK